MKEIHENQLTAMKNYFHEITTNNFAVICGLQEELGRAKEREQELGIKVEQLKNEIKVRKFKISK
jgi:hypothetical protein